MSLLPRNRILALTTLPLALGLSGCYYMDVTINDQEGVPLSELDMAGAAPVELVLAASDNVILTKGDTLSIEIEGSDEAVAAVRFVLDGDTLGVTREEELWTTNDEATIRITMPAPNEVVIAGSGNVEAQGLAQNADVSIAGSGNFTGSDSQMDSLDINLIGSGSAKFGTLTAKSIELSIAGSGSFEAAGTAESLDVNILASGGADFSELKADDVEVSIAGSGSVSVQSDGEVEANIMGSGDVNVTGDAICIENAMGSGSLTCSS